MYKLSVVIFAAAFLALPEFAFAVTPWRTTHFEVFMGTPYEGNDNVYTTALAAGFDPDSSSDLCGWFGSETGCDHAIADLESFLHDVAVTFQNEGFADPTVSEIDSIRIDESGREVVRVYLYDFGAPEPLAGFRNECDGSGLRQVLALNSRNLFRNGIVSARGYQSAAHELFHAVQFASNFRAGSGACQYRAWITEGTADAVGFDYAKKLRNINFADWRGSSTVKPWGLRKYHEPLNKNWAGSGSETASYQTLSFWRHLAEWNLAKHKGKDHPGSAKAGKDYRYLVDLFATRQSGSGGASELKWLDSWMKSYSTMNVGLAPIFAQFTASLSGYGSTRLVNADITRSKWPPGGSFGTCEEVTLSTYSPWQAVSFNLQKASSQCVVVNINADGYPLVEVAIQNIDLSNSEQKQLYIGAVGGLLVAPADISLENAFAADGGESYAWWRFLMAPTVPNYFIISNMADPAQSTQAVNAVLYFSIPDWDSTLTSKHARSDDESSARSGQPKNAKAVASRQQSLRTSPTTQSVLAAMSGSDLSPPDSACTRYECLPKTTISLVKDFGMARGQGPVASTGGLLKQTGAAQAPFAQDADAAFMEQMKLMSEHNKGNAISLSFPVINYGSTSSISNALIEVTGSTIETEDGKIADSLVSLNPMPDGEGIYLPNGSVEITEYTPHILQGTFSATLVSRDEVRKAELSRQNPILPTAEVVSGNFVVSAPWRGNGASPDVSQDSAMVRGLRNDMMDFLMKLPEGQRQAIGESRISELCELGFNAQQLASLGINGSCGGSGPGTIGSQGSCNCDCNFWQQVGNRPGCSEECDPQWRAWQCGPYLETGIGELDDETERYQARLQELGLAENEVMPMVYIFKISPPDLRAGHWEGLENLEDQQARQNLAAEIAEIEAEQAAAGGDTDAETMRYRAALEQAGYTPEEVNGMVANFSSSPAIVRTVYWNEVNKKLQNN